MAEIVLEGVSKAFGHVQALDVVRPCRRGWANGGDRRSVRLRQDHRVAPHRGVRTAGCRLDPHRPDGREWASVGAGLQARDRLRPAGRWPVPASHRRPEHRLRHCPARGDRRSTARAARHGLAGSQPAGPAAGPAVGRPATACRPCPCDRHPSRTSCSSTNHSAHWIPNCAWIPGLRSGACSMRLGITAILVTHDRDDALGFADEVALMDAGRVVRTGPPAVVYR